MAGAIDVLNICSAYLDTHLGRHNIRINSLRIHRKLCYMAKLLVKYLSNNMDM